MQQLTDLYPRLGELWPPDAARKFADSMVVFQFGRIWFKSCKSAVFDRCLPGAARDKSIPFQLHRWHKECFS
jgi:hypothetical protein